MSDGYARCDGQPGCLARLASPKHRASLEFEFTRKIVVRAPSLSAKDRASLFDVWANRYEAREAGRDERIEALCAKQLRLFLARNNSEDVSKELKEIGEEMAALISRPEYIGELGTWVDA